MFWTGLSCSAFDSPGISRDLQPALPCSRYQSRPASHVQVDHRHRCCWCHRRLPQTTPATKNPGDDPKHCEKTKRETMRIMRNQWLNPMVYQWFLDVSGCFWSINASFNRQKSKRATVVCPSRIDMPGRTFSAGGIEASGLKKVGIDSLICRCILSVQHAACIATTFPKHPQSPSQIVSWDRPQISLSCQARIGNK